MIHPARLAQVLTDLVRIESINPALVPGGSGEQAIAQYAQQFMESAGLEAWLQEVQPGRFNAVGVLRGRGGRSLMLNGHLDTVGVGGMADPFSARIVGGRLYGRGSQDMKAGVAAMLVAAESLAAEGRPAGDVIVACVADEEYQSAGTRALIASGVRADAAIVTEPTSLEIVIAHKGFAWADIETRGRAAHGSRPEEGVDAIVLMGRVLVGIEQLQAELERKPPHTLLGHGSVHASLISGGQELSSYPERCRLSLERRLLPGEDASTFHHELERIIAQLSAQDPAFSARLKFGYAAQPLETRPEAPIAQTVLRCAAAVAGDRARFGGVGFWTDAALLAEAGIPAVVFGPSGAGLHAGVEYAVLADVQLCAEVLTACARAFCL